jgi:hypothetical protein
MSRYEIFKRYDEYSEENIKKGLEKMINLKIG